LIRHSSKSEEELDLREEKPKNKAKLQGENKRTKKILRRYGIVSCVFLFIHFLFPSVFYLMAEERSRLFHSSSRILLI